MGPSDHTAYLTCGFASLHARPRRSVSLKLVYRSGVVLLTLATSRTRRTRRSTVEGLSRCAPRGLVELVAIVAPSPSFKEEFGSVAMFCRTSVSICSATSGLEKSVSKPFDAGCCRLFWEKYVLRRIAGACFLVILLALALALE